MKKLVVYFANGMKADFDLDKTSLANGPVDPDKAYRVLANDEALVNWANVSFMRLKDVNEGGEEE